MITELYPYTTYDLKIILTINFLIDREKTDNPSTKLYSSKESVTVYKNNKISRRQHQKS